MKGRKIKIEKRDWGHLDFASHSNRSGVAPHDVQRQTLAKVRRFFGVVGLQSDTVPDFVDCNNSLMAVYSCCLEGQGLEGVG